MQNLEPNALISDRFLLKEQLAVDAGSGRQIWALTDTRTSQALIGRFHTNGRIEWFSDNRSPLVQIEDLIAGLPEVSQEKKKNNLSAVTEKPVGLNAAPKPSDSNVLMAKRPRKRKRIIFIGASLFLTALLCTIGYLRQDALIRQYDKLSSNGSSSPGDSTATEQTVHEDIREASKPSPITDQSAQAVTAPDSTVKEKPATPKLQRTREPNQRNTPKKNKEEDASKYFPKDPELNL